MELPFLRQLAGAVGLPREIARPLVAGRDELPIDAVVLHDQQVLPEDRRSPGAVLMIDVQRGILPHDPAGLRVHAGGAVGSKMEVHPPVFDHRRGRGVAVERMDRLRVVDMEEFHVPQNLAGANVHANRPQRNAARDFEPLGIGNFRQPAFLLFVGKRLDDGRRQPDLIARNHGRGVPVPGEGRLPSDVFGFAPSERQSGRRAVPVAIGSAELGPLIRRRDQTRKENRTNGDEHAAYLLHGSTSIGQESRRETSAGDGSIKLTRPGNARQAKSAKSRKQVSCRLVVSSATGLLLRSNN